MGTNDLVGLEFLKKNKIENCVCDLEKNFAFISYAHDKIDTDIVRSAFKKLHDMGWNLWIDTANIPHNENAWSDAAEDALIFAKTCKLALFFRSEESLVREPIFEELEMIKNAKHINRIVTLDIFHDSDNTAASYMVKLQNEQPKKFKICKKICKIVDKDNSAIRLRTDAENDINNLVAEIVKELVADDVYQNELAAKVPTVETVLETVNNENAGCQQNELDTAHNAKPWNSNSASNVDANIWHYTNRKGANAFIVWENEYTKKCIIKKDSKVGEEAASFATSAPPAHALKQELIQTGILVNGIFQMDYPSDRISTMINLIGGGSINMRGEIQKGAFKRAFDSDVVVFDMNKETYVSTVECMQPSVVEGGKTVVFQDAKAVLAGKGCTIKAGSLLTMEIAESCSENVKRMRSDALANGEIVEEYGKYKLVVDKEFGSLSAAAGFVCGYSVNGKTAWK